METKTLSTINQWKIKQFNRQNGKCIYCDCFMRMIAYPGDDALATREHITPRSLGGSNKKTNLVLACAKCNTERGNRPITSINDYRRIKGRPPLNINWKIQPDPITEEAPDSRLEGMPDLGFVYGEVDVPRIIVRYR
jgi:hypothetical protein